MILERETFEAFRYYPSVLKPKSRTPIIAACELCGEFKITRKDAYHTFCASCMQKGVCPTEETKAKMSTTHKGMHFTKKHKANISAVRKGRIHTEATKTLISAALKGDKCYLFGKKGVKHPKYNGGKKISRARANAKRRQLGFIYLNQYFKGCEGHHITHNFIIYIPKELHKSVWHNLNTCQGMELINALALNFLVDGI